VAKKSWEPLVHRRMEGEAEGGIAPLHFEI